MKYSKAITAQRIEILQKKHGLKQYEVADKIYPGDERAAEKLNKRLSNKQKQNFTLDDLISTANAFNVTIEWLLGEGPDDPEQAAAGMRDTSKGPSLRQMAEFFYDLTRIDPGIAFETIQKEEGWFALDENGEPFMENGDSEYTAVYFPAALRTAVYADNFGDDNHLKYIRAEQINKFLETLSRLTQVHEQGNLSLEELDTLILNRIAQLPDDPIEQIRPVAVQDPAGPGAGK